ncbi:TPA: hypothetical protein KKW48_003127 [Legionella pneumophila]|nr:hypothetical protein [Legionella pneumophila]
MTIKLSITGYDNTTHWLYGETDNGKLYVFVDEWREDKNCFYPVLYICNRENRPYIPLYDENYEIGCGFNLMWDKSVVERFSSTHALYSAILEYSKK